MKLSFKIYGVIFQYEWIIFKIFLVFLSGFRVWRGRVVSINHQCHIIWLRRIQLKFLHLEELLEQLGHRIQLFVNLAHLKFKIKRCIFCKMKFSIQIFKWIFHIYLVLQSIKSGTNSHRFNMSFFINAMVIISWFTQCLIEPSL